MFLCLKMTKDLCIITITDDYFSVDHCTWFITADWRLQQTKVKRSKHGGRKTGQVNTVRGKLKTASVTGVKNIAASYKWFTEDSLTQHKRAACYFAHNVPSVAFCSIIFLTSCSSTPVLLKQSVKNSAFIKSFYSNNVGEWLQSVTINLLHRFHNLFTHWFTHFSQSHVASLSYSLTYCTAFLLHLVG